MTHPRLVSIQVGMPRSMGTEGDRRDPPWFSGIFKHPVTGPVRLTRENLDGDGQAERRFHGGLDKALLAYCFDHYARWEAELPGVSWHLGGFGENLTVSGLDEAGVCLGDRYGLGSVVLEVSEPRRPCSKLARRLGVPDLVARVHRTDRSGWYLRVVQEGRLEAGMPVTLLDRPHPEWPITRIHAILNRPSDHRDAARALVEVPELSPSCRDGVLAKLSAVGEP
jgi:MOSC domain-containing protein YiiM